MIKRFREKISGQGMVEFALILPILLLLIFGFIELSRMMFIYSVVTTASREAVRYGAAVGDNGSGTPQYLDCQGIRDAALNIGRVVGVANADVYIAYDNGPSDAGPYPICPVQPETIELGDRIIVEVRGYYNPVPAAPFVNVDPFVFASTSKRIIVKNASLIQGGTSVGEINTPTSTVAATATAGPSLTPTETLVPSATVAGVDTATPTLTPTPYPPVAPIYTSVDWTAASGNKCDINSITWQPSLVWPTYPGSSPVSYQVYKNTVAQGTVSPADPSSTTWTTNDLLTNNASVRYDVIAVFAGPLTSLNLIKEFKCQGGSLVDLTEPDPIHIAIIVPSDGAVIDNINQTEFEIEAWDTGVGASNGDGIDTVYIEILGPGGIGILSPPTDEFVVKYCAFSGNGPCPTWDNAAAILFADAPNGVYTIRAATLTDLGVVSEWVTITFTLAKP